MNRYPEALAEDIPERLVDSGNSGESDGATAIETTLEHPLPVTLDLAWIFTNQGIHQFNDTCRCGVRLTFEHRLTPADDSFIGFDLEEQLTRWGWE